MYITFSVKKSTVKNMPKGRKKQAASNENETKSSTQSTTATAHNIAEPPAWLQQLLIMQQIQMEQLQAQAQQVQQTQMEQLQAQAQQVQQTQMEQLQAQAQQVQQAHMEQMEPVICSADPNKTRLHQSRT